ncbi:M56 family metallopeptidase [Amycolatopsis roodepoortensis]|uniref:M56 family metallopeptidase n=1 Tax=Amycolatopsis roodepoortensis TaxID=700274 RepID=UPI00214C0A77|nr:M56 family metallopeptidase [Amycolatopsis roodepoortensis]UUV29960.1 M56 family metallopeptidase [Amycolatopsis roodepoortensis]
MTAALALLAGAGLTGWLTPGLLNRIDPARADPVALLVAWLLAAVGVLAATVTGTVLLLSPGHGAGTTVMSIVSECLAAISHGTPPRAEVFAGLAGIVLVSLLTIRFAVIVVQFARRRARTRRQHLETLQMAARCDDRCPRTWWLDHDEPMAFSYAYRQGVIVATEGLERHLSAAEVAAVLAHERAHLRGRHHHVITWVDALAKALPFLPLFRQAPSAVRKLVELAADVAAVREHGAETVRTALLSVAGRGTPDGTLAMGGSGVELRLAALANGNAPAGPVKRALTCVLAAATMTTLPMITGAGVLLSIAVVACPLTGV